jgi:uncharacterized protein
MKTITLIALAFILSVASFAQNVLPKSNSFVTDKANVLSRDEIQLLERRLKTLNDSTSNQIAVVLIPSLNGQNLEDYANKLFRTWGIGQKKKNNGVLILAAMNDHKIRIEVGYGLEDAIPNSAAASIIEKDIKPAFKNGKYYDGLESAIVDLGYAASKAFNDPVAPPTPQQQPMSASPAAPQTTSKGGTVAGIILTILMIPVLIIAVIVFIIIAIIRALRRRRDNLNVNNNFGNQNYYPNQPYYPNRRNDYNDNNNNNNNNNNSSNSDANFGGGRSGGAGASDSW